MSKILTKPWLPTWNEEPLRRYYPSDHRTKCLPETEENSEQRILPNFPPGMLAQVG